MDTQRSAPARRLHFLDALRGVAALAVLVQHVAHYSAPAPTAAMNHWFAPGGFGVQLFFLVSGFVIPLSLDRAGSAGRFWAGRAFRLWPLYLAALAIVVLGRRDLPPGILLPLALLNLTPLVQFTAAPVLVPNAWSLAYELVFYALLSLAYALGLRRRVVGIAVAALALALAVEGGLLWGFGATLPQVGTLFLFGLMLTGTVLRGWSVGEVSGRACGLVCALLLAVAALTVPADQLQVIGTRAAALVAFGAAYALRRRAMPPALLWLGRVSYSLYLLHGLVILAVPSTGSAALDIARWTVLSLVLAALAERWIERPGIAAGKWLLAHRAHPLPDLVDRDRREFVG